MTDVSALKTALRQRLAETYRDGSPLPLLDPEVLNPTAKLLLDLMRPARPDRIGGWSPDAAPLVGAVAAMAFGCGISAQGFLVRGGNIFHGNEERIDTALDIDSKSRVAIVVPLVADGINEALLVDRLRERELRVDIVGVYALVDLRMGAEGKLKSVGVPLHAVFTADDLPPARYADALREEIPDWRNGLKPAQRRMLLTVRDTAPGPKHRKSDKTISVYCERTGEPDPGIAYQTLVRLAQPYSIRYPLVDPQGNFGNIDGSPPAEAIYTECRLSKFGNAMLAEADSETDPDHLAPALPLFIVNGCGGSALWVTTSTPPHNLTEVCHGLAAMIDNPDITLDELLTHIQGPDFPTDGLIYGRAGIRDMYDKGHGLLTVFARHTVETDKKGARHIVVTEVPGPAQLREILSRSVTGLYSGAIHGIKSLNDHSNRKDGIRLLFGLEDDADANAVIQRLYRDLPLYYSQEFRLTILYNGRAQTMGLLEYLRCFLEYRYAVIRQRDGSQAPVREIVRKEVLELAERFGDKRRTAIVDGSPW